jgi:predicted Mrr-cat superfamily restriction endonuclease
MFSKDKFERPQPIEGAKGNIAARIEELESMLNQQDRKLDHVIEQNKLLFEQNVVICNLLYEQNKHSLTSDSDTRKLLCDNHKAMLQGLLEILDALK